MVEKQFVQKMVDGFRSKFANNILLQKIESSLMGNGIPDLYYCIDGKSGWIEVKVARVFADESWQCPHVRPEQILWHARHAQARGVSWVLVGVPSYKKQGIAYLVLLPGIFSKLLKTERWTEDTARRYDKMFAWKDWEQMRKRLLPEF